MGVMKGLFMLKDGLEIGSLPIPEISKNEVLIKINYASVCGSDYPYLSSRADRQHLVGHVMGHEGAGYVVKSGSSVAGLKEGDFVGIESHRATSDWLNKGFDSYADPLSAIIGYRAFPDGKVVQGTFAEYISVPEVYANKIPEELNRQFPGSLWEPFGNSVRIMSVVQEKLNGTPNAVVVSGAGYQGLMIMMILKHWLGFNNIYATDISLDRLKIVENLGLAKGYLADKLPAVSPNLWLEMSGSMAAYGDAMKRVAPEGSIILFGLPSKDSEFLGGLSYKEFIFQGKSAVHEGKNLVGVCGRLLKDWKIAPRIIEKICQNVDMGKLFTHYGPLDNLASLVREGEIPPKSETILKAVFSGFET